MRNYVYVCDNNKGRSPALEAYTRSFLDDLGIKGVSVSSAGIWKENIARLVREGHNCPSQTVSDILLEDGFDIRNLTLRHLGEIKMPYLVLAVNSEVYHSAVNHYPDIESRLMVAGDYAKSHKYKEIYGPFHHSREISPTKKEKYARMVYETEALAKRVALRIKRELQN